MANKLENVNIEVDIERLYNLGGYQNTLRIRRKVVGPADTINENAKEIDKMMADIEVQFGETMATSRRNIKKLAKEVFEEDGKVSKKKEE